MIKSGKVTWRSPSNIALVKYWGKKGFQLPLNPSLSLSLSQCYTETTIEYQWKDNLNKVNFNFLFQGSKNLDFEKKIENYLKIVSTELPEINKLQLNINSLNSFPHSAGIASSASSISSVALCLQHISGLINGDQTNEDDNLKKASYLARLGSGSACRSTYGGWALWGETAGIEGSSDEYAIPLNHLVHKKFRNYYDAILIVSTDEKPVSSSTGHKRMETNPYKEARIQTGHINAINLLSAMKSGDENTFSDIVENEASNLHAMFLTSKPAFILIKPETLQIINKLVKYRQGTSLDFCFTLDAGPNIHLLYPENIRDKMLRFIVTELTPLCENGKWIDDEAGNGPVLIKSEHL